MLEGLTKYWGFYLVAIPDANGVGITDLHHALERVTEYDTWNSDLSSLPSEKRRNQDELNRRITSKLFRKILAARIVVFTLFLELAIQVDGNLRDNHRRIWLLFQLSDNLDPLNPHPFIRIIECLDNASDKALDALIGRLDGIIGKHLSGSKFIIGLDEAQRAARLYPRAFLSSINNNNFRSILREMARVFTKPRHVRLVVSGTGLSLAEVRDAMASGVSKPETVHLFHKLGMFDTWPKIEPFLRRYIPDSIWDIRSGHHLQRRIREYLLGR
jgi:hypothetical protein